MPQTRSFLILALLFVTYLLWNQWQNDYHRPQPAPAAAASASTAQVPDAAGDTPAAIASATPAAAPGAAAPSAQTPDGHGKLITLTTDVLRLTVDTRGGSIVRAELLKYPEKLKSAQSVRLLDDRAAQLFVAQDGLTSATGPAPDHRTVFSADRDAYTLAKGQDALSVDLTWTDPSGLKVVKRYTLKRGSYVVGLDQDIANNGAKAWTGNAYRQLQRVVPPAPEHSNFLAKMSDQSRYSFFGAAWYSPEKKFEKLKLDDFRKEPLSHTVQGGWVAMVQHYFFAAWIPDGKEADQFSTAVIDGKDGPRYLIRALGPGLSVAPGAQASTHASLYVGPKLRNTLESIAPGLELAVDYGMFTVVAAPLHWVLDKAHALTGNWGVAIILLVLLINVVFYKLSEAQYKSSAKMRKLQPRMQALKERYGDDKQKLQQAMMELYKKEKINPVAGCFPMLVQIPVFFALYTVLRESVELRQAPFFGWIHDLSAADPYFVLPVLYMLAMLATQFLMPQTPGMDPTQQKMMRFMPIAFSVIFAFFPAGLVLYYTVNTLCRLAQQWWVTRRVEAADARGKDKPRPA